MIKLINLTTIQQSIDDDNKDLIWPIAVGIFVALALGWMICGYKCSSNERSPHIVQCCPKSLCQTIRLCCRHLLSLCRFENETQQHSDARILMNTRRLSNSNTLEIPFIITNPSSSSRFSSEVWPPPFLLNNNQRASFQLSTTTLPPINCSQAKRHPLRRESIVSLMENHNGKRNSISWPFQTANINFHKQANQFKKNYVFF